MQCSRMRPDVTLCWMEHTIVHSSTAKPRIRINLIHQVTGNDHMCYPTFCYVPPLRSLSAHSISKEQARAEGALVLWQQINLKKNITEWEHGDGD